MENNNNNNISPFHINPSTTATDTRNAMHTTATTTPTNTTTNSPTQQMRQASYIKVIDLAESYNIDSTKIKAEIQRIRLEEQQAAAATVKSRIQKLTLGSKGGKESTSTDKIVAVSVTGSKKDSQPSSNSKVTEECDFSASGGGGSGSGSGDRNHRNHSTALFGGGAGSNNKGGYNNRPYSKRFSAMNGGFNLCLLVGKVDIVVDKLRVDKSRVRLAEVQVGDETGSIFLRARDEQIDLLQQVSQDKGAVVLRNSNLELFQGKHLRLAVTKWGKINAFPDDNLASTPNPPTKLEPEIDLSLVDLNSVPQDVWLQPPPSSAASVSSSSMHHKSGDKQSLSSSRGHGHGQHVAGAPTTQQHNIMNPSKLNQRRHHNQKQQQQQQPFSYLKNTRGQHQHPSQQRGYHHHNDRRQLQQQQFTSQSNYNTPYGSGAGGNVKSNHPSQQDQSYNPMLGMNHPFSTPPPPNMYPATQYYKVPTAATQYYSNYDAETLEQLQQQQQQLAVQAQAQAQLHSQQQRQQRIEQQQECQQQQQQQQLPHVSQQQQQQQQIYLMQQQNFLLQRHVHQLMEQRNSIDQSNIQTPSSPNFTTTTSDGHLHSGNSSRMQDRQIANEGESWTPADASASAAAKYQTSPTNPEPSPVIMDVPLSPPMNPHAVSFPPPHSYTNIPDLDQGAHHGQQQYYLQPQYYSPPTSTAHIHPSYHPSSSGQRTDVQQGGSGEDEGSNITVTASNTITDTNAGVGASKNHGSTKEPQS